MRALTAKESNACGLIIHCQLAENEYMAKKYLDKMLEDMASLGWSIEDAIAWLEQDL